MIESYEFLSLVTNSMTDHIVVINEKGDIEFINKAWLLFGQDNDCLVVDKWEGVNYLAVCDESAAMGDEFGKNASAGIREVIARHKDMFYYEYPCHSPVEKRWFLMKVTPFQFSGKNFYVIAHQNITQRKIAEETANNLARIDGLTSIPNRRYFDEFLDSELRRCARLHFQTSLAILDIDHFKLLNDSKGHKFGDSVLIKIAKVLSEFGNRPGDLAARYGGEEFALIFGDTSTEQALQLVEKIVSKIADLKIPNPSSPTAEFLTVSVGLATIYPDNLTQPEDLIEMADKRLYAAKNAGRNKIVYE